MTHELSSPIRKFFEQHLTAERGLSNHTVLAYRDSLKLLLMFASDQLHKPFTDLALEDLSANMIRNFLTHLEKARRNTVRTRNARLAAIHAFFRYVASIEPRFMALSREVLGVSFKRQARRVMGYLDRDEISHLFRNIDPKSRFGLRDEAMLRFLYNTGTRAQEFVDLDINHVRFSRPFSVLIKGKGRKERTCPLWPETISVLKKYLERRRIGLSERMPLFLNAKGERFTRFGLRYVVTHRVTVASRDCPALLSRKIGPHTFRHTTAMHLLQSGVDLNMIRSWLGHASIETTNEYVELDLEMKRKTLQSVEKLLPKSGEHGPSWRKEPGIMAWLSQL